MVGLLVKLALRPNLSLLLGPRGSDPLAPFMRVFVVVLSSSLLFVPRPEVEKRSCGHGGSKVLSFSI